MVGKFLNLPTVKAGGRPKTIQEVSLQFINVFYSFTSSMWSFMSAFQSLFLLQVQRFTRLQKNDEYQ